MSEEERKRRIDEIRRELRIAHQEMMDAIDRVNKRFEPNRRLPDKSLW